MKRKLASPVRMIFLGPPGSSPFHFFLAKEKLTRFRLGKGHLSSPIDQTIRWSNQESRVLRYSPSTHCTTNPAWPTGPIHHGFRQFTRRCNHVRINHLGTHGEWLGFVRRPSTINIGRCRSTFALRPTWFPSSCGKQGV